MILPCCQKKNTLNNGIFRLSEKDAIHPRKYGVSSVRKIKDDKKVYFY